jgi:glycosyltransferase involved in cell wall biosynthesis
VLRRLGVPSGKVFFEPNGIDRRPWEAGTSGDRTGILRTRRELAGDGDGFLLGIFTRFYPYKRVDRGIVLLERFRREGVRVRLVVGGGGGPLESPLRSLVDALGLAPSVTWMGAIPFDRMPEYYRACDAVLVLNDCANTGNQVLECIHLGIPLVAIDDGVNSLLFRDCPRALFVAPADLDRLVWADIERVIGNRDSSCRSPYLRSWDTRMRLEIEWIEQISRGRGRT